MMDNFRDNLDGAIGRLKRLNMFGEDTGGLPIGGIGSSRNNGVSMGTFGTVNKAVLLSIIWLLASVGVFGMGVWHCRTRASHYALNCTTVDCQLFYNRAQEPAAAFPRKDLTQANYVRISADGKVTDTTRMKHKQSRSYGHSVELVFQQMVDLDNAAGAENPETAEREQQQQQQSQGGKVERKVLFSPEDMGSGVARRVAKKLTKKITQPSEDIYERHGFTATTIGLLGVIFGILSAVLSLLFGEWRDVSKRLKKAA